MSSTELSPWIPLTYDETGRLPEKPGAYQIRCRGHQIPRMLAVDEEGILDIGESANLRGRLGVFLYAAEGKKGPHAAGWRYNFLGLARRGFPLGDLEFRWAGAESKAAAYSLEGDLMKGYLDRFGELPPLNYKFNWSQYEE